LRDPIEAPELSSPMENLVQCLGIPGLSKAAAEILTDMLNSGDKTLTDFHLNVVLEYMISETGGAHVAALLDGDYEDEHMAFMELLLAYCSARRVEILCGVLGPTHDRLLAYLDTLFHGPGYPGAEDKVSPYLLEWWTEAADELQELTPEDTEEARLDIARRNLATAVLSCFGKVLYPSREQLDQFEDDERSEFHSFRRDARDFLLAAYPILGVEMVQLFQQRTQSALESKNWKSFEASIFCLSQLSEAVDGNAVAAQYLNNIFFDEKFAALCVEQNAQMTLKARQTLVDMLGKYEIFFERNRELLANVLTFLFTSLNIIGCTHTASRSISSLCKSSRTALTSELPVFVKLFTDFHRSPVVHVQSLERVVEGIAAIIQALNTDEAKVLYLNELLTPFHKQAMAALEDARAGDVENALNRGHLALSCVASIGRGLRADGDGVVDVESDQDSSPVDNTFWAEHQQGIVECLQRFVSGFPLDVVIIEDVCEILKAGFTEKTGLYVFDPHTTTTLLASIPLGITGAADMVMSTASAFLASHKAHPDEIREEAGLLIIHVYYAFRFMLENPQQEDPEIGNSGIGFLTRLLPKYHHILFSLTSSPPTSPLAASHQTGSQPPVLSTILDFTLNALRGSDPLPLRSASQFWVAVLNLPATTSEPVQQAIHGYLPQLCHILIAQIGGGCARSDLNHLAEVLKKIVFKYQGLAQPHLAAALASLTTAQDVISQLSITDQQQPRPSEAMSKEKERFLAMVLGARGSAATNQLVRNFWVKCRGSGFEYAG
jgi:hypothetical protein